MSEADKLFEELGYKKYDNHPEEEKEEPNKKKKLKNQIQKK